MVLVSLRSEITLKVTGSLGEATLNQEIYPPILDLLADHKPRTLGQIEQALQQHKISFAQLLNAIVVLAGAGHLYAAQDDATISKVRKQIEKLNLHLMDKARSSNDISYLASPVTGGGITIGRFQQLFLLALHKGKKQPAEWAQFVWQILSSQGQRILKEGKTLETAEEHLQELTTQAQAFADKQLPIVKALGMV